jgi:hypothetical protein
MQMKLKYAQGVSTTQEQAREIAEVIMTQPDMGWSYDSGNRTDRKTGVYDVEFEGEHGIYHYRVNLSFELITLKSVK